MAGSFPLTIDGQTFSNLTLAGKKYLHNYPDLLQAVANHSVYGNWTVARVEIKRRWFPRVGNITMTLTPNRPFESGMFFQAYNQKYDGQSGPGAVYGIIISYDKLTGVAVLSVQGHVSAFEPGYVMIAVSVLTQFPNLSAPATIAQGGTNATSVYLAMQQLEIPHPDFQLSEIYDDFTQREIINSNNLYSSPYNILDRVGGGNFDQWLGDPWPSFGVSGFADSNWTDRAGFLELGASAVSDAVTLARGNGGFHIGGSAMDFAMAVYLPDLSDGSNTYKIYVGLKGSNSSNTNPFSYSGLGFTYTHGENAGNWTTRYGTAGSMNSANSGIAVVADTWYTLRFVWNGTNVTPSINGSNLTTIAAANLPQSGNLNTVTPVLRIEKSVGATRRTLICDYIYRQKKVSR